MFALAGPILGAVGSAAGGKTGQGLIKNIFGGKKKKKGWSPAEASGLAIAYYEQRRTPPSSEPMVYQFWQILVNAYGPPGSALPARKFPPLGVNPAAPPPDPSTIRRVNPNSTAPINPRQRRNAPMRNLGGKGATAMRPAVNNRPNIGPSGTRPGTAKFNTQNLLTGLTVAGTLFGIYRALK